MLSLRSVLGSVADAAAKVACMPDSGYFLDENHAKATYGSEMRNVSRRRRRGPVAAILLRLINRALDAFAGIAAKRFQDPSQSLDLKWAGAFLLPAHKASQSLRNRRSTSSKSRPRPD